ncbi:MAG: DNA replication/repair protein RecF [Microcystaceae cyanobacterium]
MFLQSLHLQNFRNYPQQWVNFTVPKTILVGQNAQGKSNLLEAIELLATLKSHRTSRDQDLITTGEETSLIYAQIERNYSKQELQLLLRRSGRRSLKVNQDIARRQADFLGVINAVEFSCLDLELVRGTPEARRQWLDTLLLQVEPIYSHILSQYQHILKQRNALLKSYRAKDELSDQGERSDSHLSLWDQQLATMGTRIIRRRDRILQRLTPIAQSWHEQISGHQEQLSIDYQPNVLTATEDQEEIQQAFLGQLAQRRIAEQQMGTTLVGPHRDDLIFTINGNPAKAYASQGQQRTLVLALKLAELTLLEEIIGEPPLLLLDDVLAELDLQRQQQLLVTIQERFQTLITTTHLQGFAPEWLQHAQILVVKAGQISREDLSF